MHILVIDFTAEASPMQESLHQVLAAVHAHARRGGPGASVHAPLLAANLTEILSPAYPYSPVPQYRKTNLATGWCLPTSTSPPAQHFNPFTANPNCTACDIFPALSAWSIRSLTSLV